MQSVLQGCSWTELYDRLGPYARHNGMAMSVRSKTDGAYIWLTMPDARSVWSVCDELNALFS